MELKPYLFACTVALFATFTTPVFSAAILDQVQLDGSGQNRGVHNSPVPPFPNAEHTQTVTLGMSGTLDSLELSLYTSLDPSADLIVTVLDLTGGGGIAGAPSLGNVAVTPAEIGAADPQMLELNSVVSTLINLAPLNIAASAGDKLGFRLSSATELPSLYGWRVARTNPYTAGELFINDTELVDFDAAFKLSVVPIPLPAAVWLLGSSLLALRLSRRS